MSKMMMILYNMLQRKKQIFDRIILIIFNGVAFRIAKQEANLDET